MLDQSFSADNFKKILDIENRKGLYLEARFFPSTSDLNREIQVCRRNIKAEKKQKVKDAEAIQRYYKEIEDIKQRKRAIIMEKLLAISEKVSQNDFKIELRKVIQYPGAKAVYVIPKTPEAFFAIKQVQKNINKTFNVKQSDRFSIVSQAKLILGDNFPKYILRTDIDNFYETIPHDRLLKKINQNTLLSFLTKKIIKQILREYAIKSGTAQGVPRGVGISAYLAELYLRDLDREITSMPDVTYYTRYVDDILVVFTPKKILQPQNYQAEVEQIVRNNHLSVNVAKTTILSAVSSNTTHSLDFLGYRITIGQGDIKLDITASKKAKIQKKIDLAFQKYEESNDEKKARKLLVKRINFLTGNTRLYNNKKNILIGIYHSNSLLTETRTLTQMDTYLNLKIQALQPFQPLNIQQNVIEKIKRRLEQYSFLSGFKEKRFCVFSAIELNNILKIWERI